MSKWTDKRELQAALVSDQWGTPDTYTKTFKPLIDGPAVYLFLLVDADEYRRAVIAYVGMSERLSQRMQGHEIQEQIDQPGFWVQRWFKPVRPAQLRKVERGYITKFDPPWNIIGRPRGMVL